MALDRWRGDRARQPGRARLPPPQGPRGRLAVGQDRRRAPDDHSAGHAVQALVTWSRL